MSLFPFEKKLFKESIDQDSLFIYAKGLGYHRILRQLISLYCEPQFLVFILGISLKEKTYYVEEITLSGHSMVPKIINSETPSTEREQLYNEGGVVFVTSRILVVDILQERVPTENITGIIIDHVERTNEFSQETFILKLFREKNKNGFVKAFSDSPTRFTRSFALVQRVMKTLYLTKLYIRPRFHVDVKDFFSKNEAEVVELRIKLTFKMNEIQSCLMELIDLCLLEIKRLNSSVFVESCTKNITNYLKYSFSIQSQLKSKWHQTDLKTKILIEDIKTLSNLLVCLYDYDAVTYYYYLQSMRNSVQLNQSYWLLLDPTDILFKNARLRLQTEENNSNQTTLIESEPNPKWTLLTRVLIEIQNDMSSVDEVKGNVLIFVKNDNVCLQLTDYLKLGNNDSNKRKGIHLQRREQRRRERTQEQFPTSLNDLKQNFIKNNDETNFLLSENIILQSIESLSSPMEMERLLLDINPTFIVFYHSCLTLTRQTEIYRANHSEQFLRVYFLFYEPSIEEQKYANSITKEKESLSNLIREKSVMVFPIDTEDRTSLPTNETNNPRLETSKSDKKIHLKNKNLPKVLIDVREFRSQLPQLLYLKGIKVIPVVLKVGDYILSPELCVERKSIDDLIQSLNNGRLYTQCLAMSNLYSIPILLIEFDQEKVFCLQPKKDFSSNINFNHLSSKIVLLTLHFPNLRILWCANPHESADLLEKLKINYSQPDEKLIEISTQNPKTDENCFNWKIQTILRSMPGVTDENIYEIMNNLCNLKSLITLSFEEMKLFVGASARYLYDFCNENPLKNS